MKSISRAQTYASCLLHIRWRCLPRATRSDNSLQGTVYLGLKVKRFVLGIGLTLILACSLMLALNTPSVSAEYTSVELSYLAANIEDFLWTPVNTTGRRTSIITFLLDDFLEDLDSPLVGVMLFKPGGLRIPIGCVITVYGLILYEPLEGGYYYLYIDDWEPALQWNPADVNFDGKVDIYDAIIFVDAYGSTPSSARWWEYCDLAEPYGIINIYDIIVFSDSYGEEY